MYNNWDNYDNDGTYYNEVGDGDDYYDTMIMRNIIMRIITAAKMINVTIMKKEKITTI